MIVCYCLISSSLFLSPSYVLIQRD
uniref:Uncharacterized protein n=1 Tax=Arundo donax TaxID=35708 RepID=A0A0A9HL40_ARUDO